MRHHKTALCREGWGYLGLLVLISLLALLRGVNLLFVLAGMLVGPLLLSWRLMVLTLRGLELKRRLPRAICAGDLLVVDLELSNTRRRPGSWAVVVEDEIRREGSPPGQSAVRPEVFVGYVPAGGSCAAVYRGRLPRRGRYRLGPLRLSTRFPFGLARRTVLVDRHDVLYVYPRLGRLTRRWRMRHREAFEGSQRRERRYGRMSGDFYGVREWHQGDSRRWIHWRSSARHGTLVVRQFERYRSRDVALLLDLWQPARPTAEDLDNVELAVSFAATVVADLCRRGSGDLAIGVAGQQPEWIAGPASGLLQEEAMQRLAIVDAASEDCLPGLLADALRRIGPDVEIVLVSTRALDLRGAAARAGLQASAAWRSLAGRIRLVNAGGEQLAEYYQAE